jgi:hypothetical protein
MWSNIGSPPPCERGFHGGRDGTLGIQRLSGRRFGECGGAEGARGERLRLLALATFGLGRLRFGIAIDLPNTGCIVGTISLGVARKSRRRNRNVRIARRGIEMLLVLRVCTRYLCLLVRRLRLECLIRLGRPSCLARCGFGCDGGGFSLSLSLQCLFPILLRCTVPQLHAILASRCREIAVLRSVQICPGVKNGHIFRGLRYCRIVCPVCATRFHVSLPVPSDLASNTR